MISKFALMAVAASFLAIPILPAQETDDHPVIVEIGGRSIVIPLPPGDFIRIDGIETSYDSHAVASAVLAPVNDRFLMLYATAPYTSEADQKAAELSDGHWPVHFPKATLLSLIRS